MNKDNRTFKIIITMLLIIIFILSIIAITMKPNISNRDNIDNTNNPEQPYLEVELDTLKEAMYYFINTPSQIEIKTSNTTSELIYHNTKLESMTGYHDDSVVIKTSDRTAVGYGADIQVYKDIDFIDMLMMGVEAAYQDGTTINYSRDLTKGSGSTKIRFIIDICGYDNLYKYYELSGIDGYADNRIEYFKSISDEPINIRLVYNIIGNSIDTCGLYTYFGYNPIGIEEDDWANVAANWYFTYWYPMHDWKLPETWNSEKLANYSDDELIIMGHEVMEIVDNTLTGSGEESE